MSKTTSSCWEPAGMCQWCGVLDGKPAFITTNRWRSKLWVYDVVSKTHWGLVKHRAWTVWRVAKTDEQVFSWLAEQGYKVGEPRD